jgi:hypothetical protein
MTTGNEPKVLEPTPSGETGEPEVPTTEEPNPLEAQIREYEEKLAEKDKSYKGLQQKLNKVTEELGKRGLTESRIETLEQTQRILVAMLSERENINMDEIPQDKKTDYLKQYDEIIEKQKLKMQQEALAAKVRDYQARTEALKLDPQSEEYLEIRDLVIDGKFERAERKIAKLEEKSMEPKAEPKIDLEAERAKIREEVRKEILKERGELNAETGQPSGVPSDFKKIRDAS